MTNSDKLEAGIIEYYEKLFKDLKDKPINLLELGILNGDSLLYFSDYFKNGKIIGLSHKLPNINLPNNVEMIEGRQEDVMLLNKITKNNSLFDIIIDDCSHYGEFTQRSFDFLFRCVKSGGYYIIEDWYSGFMCGEHNGLEKVISNAIDNFDRLKLKEVRVFQTPQGGWLAIIQKL